MLLIFFTSIFMNVSHIWQKLYFYKNVPFHMSLHMPYIVHFFVLTPYIRYKYSFCEEMLKARRQSLLKILWRLCISLYIWWHSSYLICFFMLKLIMYSFKCKGPFTKILCCVFMFFIGLLDFLCIHKSFPFINLFVRCFKFHITFNVLCYE